MAEKEISIREWIKNCKKGAYAESNHKNSVEIACEAGWYDWFCRDNELLGKLEKFYNFLILITNDYILDNFYIWFKNNCPIDGDLYDDIRFEPFDENKRGKQHFVVRFDCCWDNCKYSVATARNSYKIEFGCNDINEFASYINNMNLEKDYHVSISGFVKSVSDCHIKKDTKKLVDVSVDVLNNDLKQRFIGDVNRSYENCDEIYFKTFKEIIGKMATIYAVCREIKNTNFTDNYFVEMDKTSLLIDILPFDSYSFKKISDENEVFSLRFDYPFSKFKKDDDDENCSEDVRRILSIINNETKRLTSDYPDEDFKFSLFDGNNKFLFGSNNLTEVVEKLNEFIEGA